MCFIIRDKNLILFNIFFEKFFIKNLILSNIRIADSIEINDL